MYKDFPSLTEAFLSYFDVDLATSVEQRDQVAQIRYRVYCEEFGYEPAGAYPDNRETDEFDAHSLHCLVTHRRTKLPAGCVRLICASEDHALPMETRCLGNVYVDYLGSLMGDTRDNVGEVSRLAVDTAFRLYPGEDRTRPGELETMDCTIEERRTFSMISMAGVLAAVAMSSLERRSEIFTMMESNLPCLLRRAGIMAEKAGHSMDYHGRRAPYYISTESALDNMHGDLQQFYDAIYQRLACHYNTAVRVA